MYTVSVVLCKVSVNDVMQVVACDKGVQYITINVSRILWPMVVVDKGKIRIKVIWIMDR